MPTGLRTIHARNSLAEMNDLNDYWQLVVDVLRDRGFQFRVKWSGDKEMTEWQPWVICPTPGYIETGTLGPVPVREVEWLDVHRFDRHGRERSEKITRLLTEIDAVFSSAGDSIQITFGVAEENVARHSPSSRSHCSRRPGQISGSKGFVVTSDQRVSSRRLSWG